MGRIVLPPAMRVITGNASTLLVVRALGLCGGGVGIDRGGDRPEAAGDLIARAAVRAEAIGITATTRVLGLLTFPWVR
jgi:hypothetical protein